MDLVHFELICVLHRCVCESDLAFRADKAAHVLHHPDDRQLNLLTESDLLSHVLQRHLLDRRGNRNHRKRKA